MVGSLDKIGLVYKLLQKVISSLKVNSLSIGKVITERWEIAHFILKSSFVQEHKKIGIFSL